MRGNVRRLNSNGTYLVKYYFKPQTKYVEHLKGPQKLDFTVEKTVQGFKETVRSIQPPQNLFTLGKPTSSNFCLGQEKKEKIDYNPQTKANYQ